MAVVAERSAAPARPQRRSGRNVLVLQRLRGAQAAAAEEWIGIVPRIAPVLISRCEQRGAHRFHPLPTARKVVAMFRQPKPGGGGDLRGRR